MPERYEDNLIYCTTCTEQPDSFYEVMAWLVNRVTPGGSHIETKDCEVSHSECPSCEWIAFLGWELKRRR